MCKHKKSCTRCSKLSGIMATKRRKSVKRKRRRSVGRTMKFNVSDQLMKNAASGLKIAGGVAGVEYLMDLLTEQFPTLNTSTTRIISKALLTMGVGYAGFTKMGKKYQKDILEITAGMATNTVITALRPQLPADAQKYLPALSGISGTPILDYSRGGSSQTTATKSAASIPLA